jgi:hypothetical protein
MRFKTLALWMCFLITMLSFYFKMDSIGVIAVGGIVAATAANSADTYSKSKYYRSELDGK